MGLAAIARGVARGVAIGVLANAVAAQTSPEPLPKPVAIAAAEPTAGGMESSSPLAGTSSAYLRLHANDPVRWRLWNGTVLDEARRENKLLYLSVGYFACHWCHVMQQESYQDQAVGRALNAGFIPVKIDRELEPALDRHLTDFLLATLGYAGWPLNVFITPEGYPLVGMTYLPTDQFLGFLDQLDGRWTQDHEHLGSVARQAHEVMRQRKGKRHQVQELPRTKALGYRVAFIQHAVRIADLEQGGFGQGAKFPAVPQLRTLLRIYADTPDPELARFLRQTLTQMARQGLRDQLGGGFFRYTTDRAWQVPHFEKMLYDNALLTMLYLEAARILKDPTLKQVAQNTLDFMLAELWMEPGVFAGSLSAVDGDNVEGGYYLWRPEELERLLDDEELEISRLAFGLDAESTLPHGHLPRLARSPEKVSEMTPHSSAHIRMVNARARAKLLQHRSLRSLPRDNNRLAAWNGLALQALAMASRTWDEPRYRNAAQALATYLSRTLWNGNTLARTMHAKRAAGTATLSDYAFVAQGLLAAASSDSPPEHWDTIAAMTREAWRRFYNSEGKTWRLSETTLIPLASEEGVLADQSLPSPSAALIATSLALGERPGYQALKARAEDALWQDYPVLERAPYAYASHIALLLAHLPKEHQPSQAAPE